METLVLNDQEKILFKIIFEEAIGGNQPNNQILSGKDGPKFFMKNFIVKLDTMK